MVSLALMVCNQKAIVEARQPVVLYLKKVEKLSNEIKERYFDLSNV